eukprot:3766156-Heterocapsa_arctica.AAC.1
MPSPHVRPRRVSAKPERSPSRSPSRSEDESHERGQQLERSASRSVSGQGSPERWPGSTAPSPERRPKMRWAKVDQEGRQICRKFQH